MTSALFKKSTQTTAAEWQKELAPHHRKGCTSQVLRRERKIMIYHWRVGGRIRAGFREGVGNVEDMVKALGAVEMEVGRRSGGEWVERVTWVPMFICVTEMNSLLVVDTDWDYLWEESPTLKQPGNDPPSHCISPGYDLW
ncbi:uncharacterized protein PADG_05576 [Paracoccidioides brasiliensis Pb18]|uniref:Uncharacterized protein n=1 Tax=Paracoccidioides brasiliensis (strain Pb18) TaxID=502780 RepID=C1GE90_PARBD|nr:uncharacterized protein PADG_05576 [Paracoccidioides brasiliensis Pb18]EEH49497.1 hypothetical protein PADG_05576 [Paracoccidioides brasiliensis Pb18]